MGKLGLLILMGAMACSSFPNEARAIQLFYIFGGTVTQKADPGNLIGETGVGNPVTYTVRVDNETPNLAYAHGRGLYEMASATLEIAGASFSCQPTYVDIDANDSLSPQSIFDAQVSASFGDALGSGYFGLVDLDQQAIPSAALPTVAFALAPFEWRDFSISIGRSGVPEYSRLIGTIDTFSIVPEPQSAVLLGLISGFCVLGSRVFPRSAIRSLGAG